MIAGLHWYPWKDYLLNNKAIWNLRSDDLWHRFSLFGGVGIPKPLENYYLGISADIWPGVRVTTGAHGFLNTKSKVVNNVITDKKRSVELAGMYIGIAIEPSSLIKLLGFFK